MTQLRQTSTGLLIASTAAQAFGFHGAARTAQRVGAAQIAIVAPTYAAPNASAANSGDATTDTVITSLRTQLIALAADVAVHVVLINELRAALVAKGLIKGAA